MDGYITEEYVRKDVYEANLKGIERLMSANMARHEMLNERIFGEIKSLNTRVDAVNTRIDSVEKRIDDLKDAQNQGLTRFGVIVALGVGLIQVITAFVLQFWK